MIELLNHPCFLFYLLSAAFAFAFAFAFFSYLKVYSRVLLIILSFVLDLS